MIGALLRAALLNTLPNARFTQQIDPFTSMPDNGKDCYGPMLLSFLEYTALTTGIAVRPALASTGTDSAADSQDSGARLLWTAAAPRANATHQELGRFNYTQVLGAAQFSLVASGGNGTFSGFATNGQQLFECTPNVRVVTDALGGVVGVWGISTKAETARLIVPGRGAVTQLVGPNEEWALATKGRALTLKLVRRVPFVPPHA
jgi:hypothetical protein